MHAPRWTLALPALCLTGIVAAQQSRTELPEEIDLRLTGVDGKPVVEETIGVTFEMPDKHHFELVTTDGRGLLQLFTPEAYRAAKTGSLRLRRAAWSEDDDRVPTRYLGVKRIAFAKLRDAKGRQPVQLEAPALAVAGRVVDRQGKPLAGVMVKLGANARTSLSNYRELPERSLYDLTVRTAADGRFAIHELAEDRSRIDLQVQSDTHVQISRPRLSVGAKSVNIVLGVASDVFAKVSGVPAGQRTRFEGRLVPREPIPGRVYFEADRNQTNGEIRFSRCIAGAYDFLLMGDRGFEAKPILTIENVKVEAGKECRDPRLAAIDVSDHLSWIEVQVSNANGEPIPRARVLVSVRRGSSSYYYPRNGATWVMIPKAGIDLSISASGYRTRTVKMARKDLKVVLRPAWRIEIKISNHPGLDASQVKILLSQQVGRQTQKTNWDFDSADDSHVVPITLPGTHVLQILAVLPAPSPRAGVRISSNSLSQENIVLGSREVVVREDQDTGEPIPFPIELSPTELAVLKSFDAVLKERKK